MKVSTAMSPSAICCFALLGMVASSPVAQRAVAHLTPETATAVVGAPSSNSTVGGGGVVAWLASWAAESPEPLYSEHSLPKVSTTVYCVLGFSFMYFFLHGALTLAGTVMRYSDKGDAVHEVLMHACTAVNYAPMLCVLFIAARMRAIQLTQGETLKYKLPQDFVQLSMLACLTSLVGQVLIMLVIPVFMPSANLKTDEDGNTDLSDLKSPPGIVKILTVVKYVFMIMLYGGFSVVIVGIFSMQGPQEIWGEKKLPVSPAVLNTILLATLYFAIYLGVIVVKSVKLHYPAATERLQKLEDCLEMSKVTVSMAPMLCILFIGARMRALQIDPLHGNPQQWAQMCFYACTISLTIQTLLVLVVPMVINNCKTIKGKCDGDVTIECEESPSAELFCTLIRYLTLFLLYGGFTAVMISVFTIEHKTKFTPPVTPSMTCVMTLTAVYFTVYLGFFICITIKDFEDEHSRMTDKLISVFDAGRNTVTSCPMLAILFVAARMRANQLTLTVDREIPKGAGPQYWAQDAMYLATWSVTLQLLAAMAVPVFFSGEDETGSPREVAHTHSHDTVVRPPLDAGFYTSLMFSLLNYICLLAMYGGACVVVVAIFQMTPEMLPPYANHSNLIPGVEIPKPPLPDTPNFF